ncbi:MAG: transporter [Firmicutes bacterium]|nr:transporter [Bacillota bacterium]
MILSMGYFRRERLVKTAACLMFFAVFALLAATGAQAAEKGGRLSPFERLKLNLETTTYSGQYDQYRFEAGNIDTADDVNGEGKQEFLIPVERSQNDSHIKRAYDLENKKFMLETFYLCKPYKNNSSTYIASPVTIRYDSGPGTEIFVTSDFLTYQKPKFGFNDITVGAKWQFVRKNPSFAIIGTCEFPSGSAGLAAGGVQPGAILAYDCRAGNKHEYTLNVGWTSNVDTNPTKRYDQLFYIAQMAYKANKWSSYTIGFAGKTPDASINGTNINYAIVGYDYSPRPGLTYTLRVSKGLAFKGEDWIYLFGVGQKI